MTQSLLQAWLCVLGFTVQGLAEPTTLVILPFDNAMSRAEGKALEKGLPDLIAAYLSGAERIQVVDRQTLEGLMAERSLAWENLLKDSAGQRAGQLAQAKYVLRGSFTEAAGRLEATALLYETETTRMVKTLKSGPSQGPAAAAESIATQVARAFATPLRALPPLPVDADPQKSLHMIYGLGYYHQGHYAKAFPEFMKILVERPRDPDAKYWLGKSFQAAGLPEQAAIEWRQFLEWFPKDPRVPEIKQLLKEG